MRHKNFLLGLLLVLVSTNCTNAQQGEFVPETVIKNMYESFEDPWNDDIEYTEIIYVG